MYTTRKDKPLDPISHAILVRLHAIAGQNNMAYLVIGATARDIVMTHVFGIDAGRATRDVDLAIALENWQQFEAVKQDFIASGDFHTGAQAHRLYYRRDVHGAAYPVDLIPFGAIERARNEIAWPPDMHVVMNVAGYAEALQSASLVDIGDGVVISVVSLPALAALKLLAWQDRGLEDSKECLRFLFLLKNYGNAGNIDRIYEEVETLLASNGFDPDLAGATLLGNDARRLLNPATRKAILDLLAHPTKRDRLVLHVGQRIEAAVVERFILQFERGLTMDLLETNH
jgi:predicted nucleotidyltransferase